MAKAMEMAMVDWIGLLKMKLLCSYIRAVYVYVYVYVTMLKYSKISSYSYVQYIGIVL